MPSDDELARTATAGSGDAPPRAVTRTKLGRFELQGELGAGGMGVVHAAFDPELERRVAVKVLHGKNAEARARLLREARAMAKLSHANVITVFDVGTADGEDFVAMELIEGGTLGDWIQRAKPRPREVIAAFVAAGRGLAAAHAEGLVHRDFKPSNVLRSRGGRIVVTDFGLARAEGADRASGPAIEQPDHEMTRTGALLGTPGYMAPEQWQFEAVTPATDQFAFCVALWEALAGKRPYRGETLDQLRDAVLGGPVDLDDDRIPRKLRPVLRRGLAVDPAKRWPSMTALLDAIERASSRRGIALGLWAVAAAAVVYLAAGHARSTCGPPAIDLDAVTLTAGAKPYVEAWRTSRAQACEAKRDVRAARIACLDGVLARIADAFHDRTPGPDALGVELVDPAVCAGDRPPHLLTAIDAPLSSAFGVLAQAKDRGTPIDSELTAATQPACVRTVALLARRVGLDPAYDPTTIGAAMQMIGQLESASGACDDDALKAQAALAVYTGEPDTIDRVERVVKQFPSDANTTALVAIHADIANEGDRLADALAQYETVLARHAAAGRKQAELDTALEMMKIRIRRSFPDDLTAIEALADRYRALAHQSGRDAGFAALEARARWRLGDVAAANTEALAAGTAYSPAKWVDAKYDAQTVKGTVVDERGQPVANAKVVAAARLSGDDVALSSPVAAAATTVEATTAADGTFQLVGARKAAMASAGDQVSLPVALAPGMTLRLGPTSTVEGDVALGAEPFTTVRVAVFISADGVAQLHAGPVDRTGHFKLSRVPRGNHQIAAIHLDDDADKAQDLAVTAPAVTGVHVSLRTRRPSVNPLYLIGRSETATPPDSAMAFVFAGDHPELGGTVRHLMQSGHSDMLLLAQRDAAQLSPAFTGHVQPDDLTGELPTRSDDTVTICVVGVSKKQLASTSTPDQVADVLGDSAAACAVVPPTESVALITIPAIKRRDR